MSAPIRPPPATGSTWLDKFPPDVCARIAVHVSNGRQTEDALSLTRTSAKQEKAVLASLSHNVKVNDARHDGWVSPIVRSRDTGLELNLSKLRDPKRLPTVHLFSIPLLRSAHVHDSETLLRSIAQVSSLRELSVTFFRSNSHAALVDTLQVLQVRKLTLSCQLSLCLFHDRSDSAVQACHALPSCCSILKSLEINCSAGPSAQQEEMPVWRVLPQLPALCELSLREAPPHIVPWLSTLASVSLVNVPESYLLALRLGRAVTALVARPPYCEGMISHRDCLNSEQVASLAACPCLATLGIGIQRGAEAKLPDTIRKLPSLRRLSLRWNDLEAWRAPMPLPTSFRLRCYTRPSPDVLPRTVQAAPRLAELTMWYVRIPLIELTAILSHIGARLEIFATSIAEQDEPELDRLESLLYTIINHNPARQGLIVTEFMTGFELPSTKNLAEVEQLSQQKHRILAAHRRLQQQSPTCAVPNLLRCMTRRCDYWRLPRSASS